MTPYKCEKKYEVFRCYTIKIFTEYLIFSLFFEKGGGFPVFLRFPSLLVNV